MANNADRHPMNGSHLKKLLTDNDKNFIFQLQMNEDGLMKLVANIKHSDDNFSSLVQIVTRLCSQSLHRVFELNAIGLMEKLMTSQFPSRLNSYIIMKAEKSPDDCLSLFSNTAQMLSRFSKIFPHIFMKIFNSVVVTTCDAILAVQKKLNSGGYGHELISQLRNTSQNSQNKTDQIVDGMCRDDYINAISPKDSFRKLSPTICYKDVHKTIQPVLYPNIINGKYDSVEHYLEVQFRLFREDFVGPMREAILEFRKQVVASQGRKIKLNGVNIYYFTRFRGTNITRTHGVTQELYFDVASLPYVDWKNTKRLLCGSLVCLSSDNFDHFTVAVVSYSSANTLANGIVHVKLLNTNYDQLSKPFVMIESPTYHEAYAPVLKGLKTINESNLLFKKYIVDLTPTIKHPNYLLKTSKFNTGATSKKRRTLKLTWSPLNNSSWPSAEQFMLDESQNRALRVGLTQEIAIIQGPPATGKTYVGLKLVQIMLENNCGQILIVCFTNHALDQFLEGILEFCSEGLVRVGGQSKSEKLAEFNLRCISLPKGILEQLERYERKMHVKIRQATQKTEKHRKFLNRDFDTNIIPEWLLADLDVISNHHFLQLEEAMFEGDPGQSNCLEIWLDAKNYRYAKYILRKTLAFNSPNTFQFNSHPVAEKDVEDVLANEEKAKRIQNEEAGEMNFLETNCIANGFDWLPDDEVGNVPKSKLQQMVQKVTDQLKRNDYMPVADANRVDNIWNLSSENRWKLYRTWIVKAKNKCKQRLNDLDTYCDKQWKMFNEFKQECFLKRFKDAKIIGMTTSGAAIHRRTLQRLQLPILIVEEAAEVLESHVISSLTPTCQHLILIGDQQQLRPKPNVYELAKDFNLDVSLFERFVKNGFPYERLQLQHRMRPEISSLLVPNIYSDLIDHPIVKLYGNIAGMKTSVYFFDHKNEESKVTDSKSKSNYFEAELLIGLCDYLIKQGYEPSKITILTGYLGQVALFAGNLPEDVRCTSIDGYQGEENDIILLSLVRSNSKGNVGFLKVENRVCVALSRAKKGLYCVGNFDLLSSETEVWKPIVQKLDNANLIGNSFSLVCQNHPQTVTEIFSVDDFNQVPYGGCSVPCSAQLQCGHNCPLSCHVLDRKHEHIECGEICFKPICEFGHKCHKPCGVECGICDALVLKRFLCGHENIVPCNVEPISLNCPTIGIYELGCGHTATVPCASLDAYRCQIEVERLLPCGHTQAIPCSTDPQKYVCMQKCMRRLKCGHEVSASCGTILDMIICLQKCDRQLACGHKCQQVCNVVCESSTCSMEVEVKSSCGHSVLTCCSKKNEAELHCTYPCITRLPCGHVCRGTCSTCLQGRIHISCKEKCSRILLSGNPCSNICSRVCSIRWTASNVRCRHGKKSSTCGLPCKWVCPHKKCSNKCHQRCNRDPCDEPCPMRLSCKHACAGYCGEPCPKFCRVCSKNKSINLHVIASNSSSKLILLEDCNHAIERSVMDRQMKSKDAINAISLQQCPLCDAIITSNLRYANTIKECKEDVATVKREVCSFTSNFKRKTRGILASIDGERSNLNPRLPEFINSLYHFIETENYNTFDLIFLNNISALMTKIAEIYKKLEVKRRAIEGKLLIDSIDSTEFKKKSRNIEDILKELNLLDPVLKRMVKQRSNSDSVWRDLQRDLLRIEYLEQISINPNKMKIKNDKKKIFCQIMTILNTKDVPFSVEQEKNLQKPYFEWMEFIGVKNCTLQPLNIVMAPVFLKGRWFKCKMSGHIFANKFNNTPTCCPKCNQKQA
ncbi:NFX1-type zinc finger-containing protein 1 [Chamberlinius hualienensis]